MRQKVSSLKILFFATVVATYFVHLVAAAEPVLKRIRIATITTTNLTAVERDYGRWLKYGVRERGKISRSLAQSWGAPEVAGNRYILMSPAGSPDVFIRAIEQRDLPVHKPLTTWGWNAIEIIVDDPDATYASLRDSPFKVIGEPAQLSGYPSIRAFQVQGPSNEVIYLTAETGDRNKSILPPPASDIDRIFIMVVAGPDIDALLNFYSGKFALQPGTPRQRPVGVLQRAQGLDDDSTFPLTTARLVQRGNLIEFDGYPVATSARPQRVGELPPAIAGSSFAVSSFDGLALDWITPPAVYSGLAYAGKRAATVRGPAGELIELIEESAD
jgi:hypothetical protein